MAEELNGKNCTHILGHCDWCGQPYSDEDWHIIDGDETHEDAMRSCGRGRQMREWVNEHAFGLLVGIILYTALPRYAPPRSSKRRRTATMARKANKLLTRAKLKEEQQRNATPEVQTLYRDALLCRELLALAMIAVMSMGGETCRSDDCKHPACQFLDAIRDAGWQEAQGG